MLCLPPPPLSPPPLSLSLAGYIQYEFICTYYEQNTPFGGFPFRVPSSRQISCKYFSSSIFNSVLLLLYSLFCVAIAIYLNVFARYPFALIHFGSFWFSCVSSLSLSLSLLLVDSSSVSAWSGSNIACMHLVGYCERLRACIVFAINTYNLFISFSLRDASDL